VAYIRYQYKLISVVIICLSINLFAGIPQKDSSLVIRYYNRAWELAYSDTDSAISLGKRALSISEKNHDPHGIAKSFYILGTFYFIENNYDSAIYYYECAIKAKNKLSDRQDISSILNNIGLIYFEKGASEDKTYFDSALAYHNKALDYRKETGDERSMAESYMNIGNIFSELGNSAKALYYYGLARKIIDRTDHDACLATLLYNIARVHIKNNEPDLAINNYMKSIEIAEKINDRELLKDNYNSIAKAYAQKKDFTSAYEYSSRYNILADSIYSLESRKKIAQMSTDYETQKKENTELKHKTKIRTLKLKRSRIILYISIIIILAISVLVLFLLKYVKNQKKTTKMLVDQNYIISQKNDIITDNLNYAKMIQAALLPSHKDFKKLFPDSFLLFMPKDIIGGDFVWYKCIKDTKIFALIDCTGHGVSAGLMSVIGNTLLNKIIVDEGTIEPDVILYKLDSYYKSLLANEAEKGFLMDGMDIALCTVNSNKLVFSGSYMPVCFISDGKLEIFKGARYILGGNIISRKSNFINETIRLKKGDYLYMLTDGYYDQFGGQSFRPLRFKNFEKLLLSNYQLPMDEQEEFYHKYIIDWIGDYEQLDDITLVGIKF